MVSLSVSHGEHFKGWIMLLLTQNWLSKWTYEIHSCETPFAHPVLTSLGYTSFNDLFTHSLVVYSLRICLPMQGSRV